MKIINKDAYKVIKKEDNSFYDILLCNTCLQSCLRCNYSRHKKSPKHLRELDKINIPIVDFKECPTLVKEDPIILFNHKTFYDEVDGKEGKELDNNTEDKIDHHIPLYM